MRQKFKFYGLLLMALSTLLFLFNAFHITFNIQYSYLLFFILGFILLFSGGVLVLKGNALKKGS